MSSSNKGKEKISLRPLNPQKNDFDDTPLWNHVKVINLASGGGGNRVWSCNYCHKKVTGSYSKVKAHLLRLSGSGVTICNSISDDIAAVIKKEHEDAERKKANKEIRARRQADYLSLPPGTDLLQQKKRKPGALENAFNVADRDTADKLCARMFYACALPFNLVRSPQFRKYSLFLANSRLTGYIPPSYDGLRTTLLAQEKAHINVKVHHIKESWNKKGLSICSDGWSDIQRNPLINIMAASESGALFLSSTNASGEVKDAEYVANIFIRAIEDVGPNNVVQVITDNASNYKAAGGIIELKYPHIFWTPCVVHSLNLALKRMCDPPENIGAYVHCAWISKLIADCQSIRNFIMNHDLAHAIFNNYSSLKLLKIAETRFASGIIMADRLSKVRKALESMIMDERWKTYKGDGKSVVDSKAREVKQCIVDDQWWDTLDYLLNLTRPIIDFIRVADTDSPILHLVYDMWDSMIEEIKTVVFRHEGKDLLVVKDLKDPLEVHEPVINCLWPVCTGESWRGQNMKLTHDLNMVLPLIRRGLLEDRGMLMRWGLLKDRRLLLIKGVWLLVAAPTSSSPSSLSSGSSLLGLKEKYFLLIFQLYSYVYTFNFENKSQ
ncbi:Unknown protein [Striga hermonthica]|uniref:DUF659 domain-containing protein n=1 Tax=Striga hermonthica TaxID=68872 RepID=A0A9N7ML78_STRHE|nr:Unknown protein [Striga hermonthica]